MKTLAKKVVEIITSESISVVDRLYLIELISDLLGDRKELYEALKQQIILPEEAASCLMAHIDTADNGRFSDGKNVIFDTKTKLANFLKLSLSKNIY